MAWALVQNPAPATGSGASINKAFGSNVTAGNAVVACATVDSNTTCTFSSSGDSWTTLGTFFESAAGQLIAIGIALNVTGGAKTVTATFGVTGNFDTLIIAELSGGPTTLTQDGSTAGRHNTASTTPTDAALVTTLDGDLILSGLMLDSLGTTITAGGSFTLIGSDTSNGLSFEFFSQSTHGSISASFNSTASVATGIRTFAVAAGSAAAILDARTVVVPESSQPNLQRPQVSPAQIGPPQVIRLPQIAVVQNPRLRPGPAPFALNPPFLPTQAIAAAPIVVASQFPIPQLRGLSVSPAQIIPPATAILPLTVTVVAEQFRPSTVAPIVLTPPPLPQAPAPITVAPARAQPPLAAVITLVPPSLPQAAAPIVVVTSTWRPATPQTFVSQPQFAPVVAGILDPRTLVVPQSARPAIFPVFVSPPSYLPPPAIKPVTLVVAAYRQPVPAMVTAMSPPFGADHLCVTPRPGSGTTTRPGSGITLRPGGSTSRPNSGITLRPNTGQTEDPC